MRLRLAWSWRSNRQTVKAFSAQKIKIKIIKKKGKHISFFLHLSHGRTGLIWAKWGDKGFYFCVPAGVGETGKKDKGRILSTWPIADAWTWRKEQKTRTGFSPFGRFFLFFTYNVQVQGVISEQTEKMATSCPRSIHLFSASVFVLTMLLAWMSILFNDDQSWLWRERSLRTSVIDITSTSGRDGASLSGRKTEDRRASIIPFSWYQWNRNVRDAIKIKDGSMTWQVPAWPSSLSFRFRSSASMPTKVAYHFAC